MHKLRALLAGTRYQCALVSGRLLYSDGVDYRHFPPAICSQAQNTFNESCSFGFLLKKPKASIKDKIVLFCCENGHPLFDAGSFCSLRIFCSNVSLISSILLPKNRYFNLKALELTFVYIQKVFSWKSFGFGTNNLRHFKCQKQYPFYSLLSIFHLKCGIH